MTDRTPTASAVPTSRRSSDPTPRADTQENTVTDQTTMTAYEAAQQAVTDWERNLEAAREELTKLDETPPTDAASARKVAANTAIAREYVTRCEHALEAALERHESAARAVVAAEADVLEPALEAVRAELATHDTITEGLKAKLREHTGRDWAELDPFRVARERGATGALSFAASTRERLTQPLRALERQQEALRAAARGEDPIAVCEAEELPDSLRPGGVLPSASLVERQRMADEAAREQAEIDARMAEAQQHLDAAYRALDLKPAAEATHTPGDEWAVQRGRDWGARFAGIMSGRGVPLPGADLQAQNAHLAALETIAALAGWDAGDEAANALQRRSAPADGPSAAY